MTGGADPAKTLTAMRPAACDNARTPMQWDDPEHAGITTGSPWMSVNPNYTDINADAEQADPGSVDHYCRELIA